ncbi:hypothetical protein [Streptomyces sp. NPDC050564]|uniref:hypothetical protein n=1 Tax=Streptomyces sp. NPDC050564 TaxID=3365631 RepID=UPI00378E321B
MAGRAGRTTAQELKELRIRLKESDAPRHSDPKETPGSPGSVLRRIRAMGYASAPERKALHEALAPIVAEHGGPKALGMASMDQLVDRVIAFAEHVGYGEFSLHQLLNSKGGTYHLFRGYLWELIAPHNPELRERARLASALTVGAVNAALSRGTAELTNGGGQPVFLRGQFGEATEAVHVEREVAPNQWKLFRDRITVSEFTPEHGHAPGQELFLWPSETELKVSETGGASQVAAGAPRTEASLKLRWVDETTGKTKTITRDQLIRDPAQLTRQLLIPKLDDVAVGHDVRLGHGTYKGHGEDYIHVEVDASGRLIDAIARSLMR